MGQLIESNDEQDWEIAFERLTSHRSGDPKLFLPLAYRYWSAKKTEKAIEAAEIGLSFAEEGQKIKFKNSLAYYYAVHGNVQYESLARKYAEDAFANRPDHMKTLDTKGFVLISFARTAEEIAQGLRLCTRAYELGNSEESLSRAVERANSRMPRLTRRTGVPVQ